MRRRVAVRIERLQNVQRECDCNGRHSARADDDAFDPHSEERNERAKRNVNVRVIAAAFRDVCSQFGVTISP